MALIQICNFGFLESLFLQPWTIVVACGGVVAIQVERLTAKWQQGAGDFQSVFQVLTSEQKGSTYELTRLGFVASFRFGTFEEDVED